MILKRRKSSQGYATADPDFGGLDYQSISRIMTESGYEMNAISARMIFIKSLAKIAKSIVPTLGDEFKDLDPLEIAKHPQFQAAVQEFLHMEESR